MSIQQKIDTALSDTGRHIRSIFIDGDSGSADIPEDVTVSFRNCTISSLSTAGNNRVNVEGGTIDTFDIKDTALLVRGATISGDGTADGSKVDINSTTISGKITLKDASSLASRKNTYSGSQAFDVQDGSKVRSVKDQFSCSTLLKGDGRGTELQVIEAQLNVSKLVTLTGGASAILDGGTFQCSDCGTVDASNVEVRNFQNVQTTTLFKLSNGGRAVLRKIQTLTASSPFDASSESAIEVVDVQTATVQNFIKLDASRAEVSRFTTITCTGTFIDAKNDSSALVGNGKTLTVSGSLGKLDQSNLTVVNCETVTTTQAVTLKNVSVFVGKGCKTLTGSSTLLSGQDEGTIQITNCETVQADTIISTNGVYSVTLHYNQKMQGSTVVAVMTSDGSAILDVKGCDQLQSSGDSVFDVTGVNCTFTDLPDVENDGTRYTVKGRDGGSQIQQMTFSKVTLSGGFDLQQYHVWMFGTTFEKFNTQNCDLELSRCVQQQSQVSDDSRFDNSWVKGRFSIFATSIYGTQSLLDFAVSDLQQDFKTADCVLQLSVMKSNVGLQSDSSTSRGNVATFSGYDVGTIQAASNKKDSFVLANVGSPSYSGQGAGVILQTTPPGTSLLDFLYVANDDIKLFDYRNSYVDVQQDIATTSTDGNVSTSAPAGTISESAMVAFNVDADGSITLTAPSITETS